MIDNAFAGDYTNLVCTQMRFLLMIFRTVATWKQYIIFMKEVKQNANI